jgi:prophage DNA circulation protein
MFKQDALEAEPIVEGVLEALLKWAPTRGRPGADLRAAVNYVRANVAPLLQTDTLGPPVLQCFELAVATGINLQQMERVRATAETFAPTLVGAIMIRDSLILLAMSMQSNIIIDMEFVSRSDVENTKAMINASFGRMEEVLADQMDSTTFQAVIGLHAAITFYLIEHARPLPRMLNFSFNVTMPSLLMAHRLYADAGRADDIRQENKIVHPLFCPRTGRALSN